jgi:hypothetical protein
MDLDKTAATEDDDNVETGETEFSSIMSRNGDKQAVGGGFLKVDRDGLLRLIDEEARQLGLDGQQALDRLAKGQAGDNYIWSDISLLASLLPHTK